MVDPLADNLMNEYRIEHFLEDIDIFNRPTKALFNNTDMQQQIRNNIFFWLNSFTILERCQAKMQFISKTEVLRYFWHFPQNFIWKWDVNKSFFSDRCICRPITFKHIKPELYKHARNSCLLFSLSLNS